MSISFWSNSLKASPKFKTLIADTHADVCVVGAGMAGIATAYLLQKSGKTVCVLEADEIGNGQTARTTAHFTTVLDERYHRLEKLHGLECARLAAESHHAALLLVEQIVREEKIECDFKKIDGFLFQGDDTHQDRDEDFEKEVAKEIEAIHRAGLRDVYSVSEIPGTPFGPGPAICYPDQIQLHPLKMIYALAEKFVAAGGIIHTQTFVKEIKGGRQACVTTALEAKVWCESIVVATNSPINDIFSIHTKQAPYRSYVVSARISKGQIPEGLYWDTEEPYHYVRLQADPTHAANDILIVGGEDHKTGQNQNPEAAYDTLEAWMKKHFLFPFEITDRWSGQVMEPVDGLGFLGHNPLDRNNVYVITGHSGNGMSYGFIGAQLIRDQIEGRLNAWEKLYAPARKNLRAFKNFVQENANVAAQYSDWLADGDVEDVSEIARGEGALVREGAHLVAAYRDVDGNLTTVSATCPHLGGIVHWNSAEKSWDCPCHGSRFDAKGNVIEGPACSSLKPYWKAEGERISQTTPLFKPVLNLSGESS